MMRFIKKVHTSFFILFLALGSITVAPLYSYDNDIDDDSEFDADFDLDFSLESLDEAAANRTVISTDDTTLLSIINTLKNYNYIKKPLWKNTASLKPRDVLYYQPHALKVLKKSGISNTFFCNITNKTPLTASSLIDSSGIDTALLGLFLENVINGKPESNNTQELNDLLFCINKTTIQERKIGTLINGGFVKGPFSIQLQTSIQLAERNFWLNAAESDQIALLTESLFGASDSKISQSEFYRIKTGFGDTRLKIGLNAFTKPHISCNVGLEGIIPTGSFSLNKPYIKTPDELILDTDALKHAAFEDLYNLRDALVTPQLGNSGHLGIGFFTEVAIKLPPKWGSLWIRTSYDKLFPNNEYRLVQPVSTMTADNLIGGSGIPSDVFIPPLKQFISEYFLPSIVSAKVQPGDIINAVVSYTVPIKQCTYTSGYNFYAQTKETFNSINIPGTSMSSLQLDKATNTFAYQHKLFSELSYDKKNKNSTLSVSLGGDFAVVSSKIGQDWTVYLRAGASF